MQLQKYSHRAIHRNIAVTALALLCACSLRSAAADELKAATPPSATDQTVADTQNWAIYGQFTNITQKHPAFTAPYSGANSLSVDSPAEETSDMTLFAGRRLWHGAEFWINPEVDQGFGFDNTLGMAGFPNGGAYKVGENTPYLRFPRAFLRQTISLGGAEDHIEAGVNQFEQQRTINNLTLTVGKFAVPDIFDTNRYAHDPRADFLNWSVIEGGAFDYAADPWGYTYGAAAEWTQSWWTLRAGFFQLSGVPNGKISRIEFGANSTVLEAEIRQQWLQHPGKIKFLVFDNHGSMASYQDAVQLGQQSGQTPDVSQVRKIGSKGGFVLNLEQELSADLGAFARYSANNGSKETYEFTDINQSFSAGLSLSGDRWGRHDDTVGIAAVSNRISGAAQSYFAAGGLGLLIGDGRLNYAPEDIVELYYSLHATSHLAVTLDYQHVDNPAYNQDRGPVSIYGIRLHANF